MTNAWSGIFDYCKADKNKSPYWGWTLFAVYNILNRFSGGITYSVLLTELELQWY